VIVDEIATGLDDEDLRRRFLAREDVRTIGKEAEP
jgi:hypothetical protein